MIAFIDDHRPSYAVEPICRELPIAPSTYHAEAARRAGPSRAPPRGRRDVALRGETRRVWQENFGVYGVRKVWRQLGREGSRRPVAPRRVARCTVTRLMRQMGLHGPRRGGVGLKQNSLRETRRGSRRSFEQDRLGALRRSGLCDCPTDLGMVG
jgi:hypothetical protein